jgi:hypothetical protein
MNTRTTQSHQMLGGNIDISCPENLRDRITNHESLLTNLSDIVPRPRDDVGSPLTAAHAATAESLQIYAVFAPSCGH